MAVSHPWGDFYNQFINSVKDLSSFATLFSFLILLIGRKNLGRWHFPTLMVLQSLSAFSAAWWSARPFWRLRFLRQLRLASFRCATSFVRARCRSKSAWSSCCWRLRRFSASCGICSITCFSGCRRIGNVPVYADADSCFPVCSRQKIIGKTDRRCTLHYRRVSNRPCGAV